MKIRTLLSLSFILTLAACNPDKSESSAADEVGHHDGHNAENALSYAGVYREILPCADCPGIETTLELDYKGNYVLTQNYQERDSAFVDQGRFTWNKQGSIITLEGTEGPRRYFVGENILYPADENGKIIESDSGLDYTLKMVQSKDVLEGEVGN